MGMKLQLTALAAAVSLALSSAAIAQTTVTSNSNLNYTSIGQPQGGGYGVDNGNSTVDNAEWTGFPPSRDGAFTTFRMNWITWTALLQAQMKTYRPLTRQLLVLQATKQV